MESMKFVGTRPPGTIDAVELSGVDAVVHLAGENVAGHRWTESFKAQIRDSRVLGTRLLCETIAGLMPKPAVLVSASAVGYYGDRGDELVDESSPPGRASLPTCVSNGKPKRSRARCRRPRRQLAVRRRAQPRTAVPWPRCSRRSSWAWAA